MDPVQALQEVLDGSVRELREAQHRVNLLEEHELWRETMIGRIPNEWIRLRDDYRSAVERIANACVRNGLAERAVAVSEARAVLMVQMVLRAAERAGLDRAQIRELGAAIREETAAIRSGEAPPLIEGEEAA